MNGPGTQGIAWLVNPLACFSPLLCVLVLLSGSWSWPYALSRLASFVVPRGDCFVWVGGCFMPPGRSIVLGWLVYFSLCMLLLYITACHILN
jgi:hypothetical protein